MSQFSIHRAAQEGQPGLVRKLLSDKPTLISSVDDVRPPPLFGPLPAAPSADTPHPNQHQDGRTPLHWAASATSLELMESLLNSVPAPDLEATDLGGSTPLIIAGPSLDILSLANGSDLSLHFSFSPRSCSERGYRGQRGCTPWGWRQPRHAQRQRPDSAVRLPTPILDPSPL